MSVLSILRTTIILYTTVFIVNEIYTSVNQHWQQRGIHRYIQ